MIKAEKPFIPDQSHKLVISDSKKLRPRLKHSFRSMPLIWLGKFLRFILRIVRPGAGSALPGRIIELLDRKFIVRMLNLMPRGVVVISGTNGKTTTAHVTAELLEEQGLRVFSNKSGSNFVRGVISSLLAHCSIFGSPKADVAVLELDEAHAKHFVKLIKPDVCVILNVMRDQLDRFGEIDKTAQLLGEIVKETKDTVILNREDTRVSGLAQNVAKGANAVYFGYAEPLKKLFITDDEMHNNQDFNADDEDDNKESENIKPIADLGDWKLKDDDFAKIRPLPNEVILLDLATKDGKHFVKYSFNSHIFEAQLHIPGAHNALNLTAALTAVRSVMKNDLNAAVLFHSAKVVKSAFGRGEIIEYDGVNVELVLVKNPAGFRIALISFEPNPAPTLIAVNDDFADSRDVSWLWDVDFDLFNSRRRQNIPIYTSGTRCYEIALRLEYSDIFVKNSEQSIKSTIFELIDKTKSADIKNCRVYATYTAMLQIRQILKKKSLDG